MHRTGFLVWVQIIIIGTLVVYTAGIFITLMEPDAVVYADISMEMVLNNNYFDITLKGNDWLDKPHFQFWITALFYKIFGINTTAYKLPAILFSLMGAFYVFLFGKRFYSVRLGTIAMLFFLTAEHIIISNNDVRAEPYLTGLTIFSMYYFALYLEDKKFLNAFLGAFGLACLLMTKGMFTILPVASGIGLTLLYRQKWKEILHGQWLMVIVLTLVLISPMLMAYYLQFDLHPEKEFFGRTGVSGIKFFLWDSQWGRFTNSGPIKGEGDVFFFLHTMLWAFAPWALLAYSGLFIKIRDLFRRQAKNETYTIFGFLFTFLIFSVSRFQLPHYINQLFPFLAIITADVLLSRSRNINFLRVHYVLMVIISLLFIALVVTLHLYFFKDVPRLDVALVFIAGLAASLYFIVSNKTLIKRIIVLPALIILSVNYYLNRQFYPELLQYQSTSEAVFYMLKNKLPVDALTVFEKDQWIINFYLMKTVPEISEADLSGINLAGKLVFTDEKGLSVLEKYGYLPEPIKEFEDFHVTEVRPPFLNKSTRKSTLKKTYLVYIQ